MGVGGGGGGGGGAGGVGGVYAKLVRLFLADSDLEEVRLPATWTLRRPCLKREAVSLFVTHVIGGGHCARFG